jgi:hypothetical protein
VPAHVRLDLVGSPGDPQLVVQAGLAVDESRTRELLDLAARSCHCRQSQNERFGVERLHQIIPRPGTQRGDVLGSSYVRGNDDDRRRGAHLADVAERAAQVDRVGIVEIVPDDAVDAQSLIAFSDLVVSAGGTINREAVALGVPVWTTFGGRLGGVDEALLREGRLRVLDDPDALELEKRQGSAGRIRRDPHHLLDLLLPV